MLGSNWEEGQRNSRRLVSQEQDDSISVGEKWKTKDLCKRCRSCQPARMLKKKECDRILKIAKGWKCPLCRFYAAVVGSPENSALLEDTVTLKTERPIGSDDLVYLTARAPWKYGRLILPLGADIGNHSKNMYGHLLDGAFVDCRILEGWLTHCQTKHNRCSISATTESLPHSALRFIDCFANELVAAPADCKYVALSYVWGGVFAPGERLGPLKRLPQTIKDAIHVTTCLEIQYLWVDQYCINQSDSSEMLRQLSVMDLIYNQATFTIIAAAGADASSGLPGISRPRAVAQSQICINGTTWVSCLDQPMRLVQKSKWYTRAWTYQEGVCSSRRLIFTEELVLFECATSGCDEINDWNFWHGECELSFTWLGPTTFRGPVEQPVNDTKEITKHVYMYTKRELSHQSDILNAMRGIFRIFRSNWGIGQLWGLSLKSAVSFTHGLSWSLASDGQSARRRIGFPSWSWAGWLAPIDYPVSSQLEKHSYITRGIEFEFERSDGTMTKPNEAFGSAGVDDIQPERYMYTSTIRITCHVLTVKFSPYKARTSWGREAVVVVDDKWWLFQLTRALDDCPELKQALFTDLFDAIILADLSGLVVWNYEGVTERIGILDLLGETRHKDLFDYLPVKRKSILLS